MPLQPATTLTRRTTALLRQRAGEEAAAASAGADQVSALVESLPLLKKAQAAGISHDQLTVADGVPLAAALLDAVHTGCAVGEAINAWATAHGLRRHRGTGPDALHGERDPEGGAWADNAGGGAGGDGPAGGGGGSSDAQLRLEVPVVLSLLHAVATEVRSIRRSVSVGQARLNIAYAASQVRETQVPGV